MISVSTSTSDSFFKTRVSVNKQTAHPSANFLKKTFSILTRREKKHFSFLILADIVVSIVDILSLALLLWIVQYFVHPDKQNTLFSLPDWLQNQNSIAFLVIFFILFSAKNFAAFAVIRAQHHLIGRVAVRISQNNLVRYQNSEFEEFINIDSSIHLRNIGYQPFDFCLYMLSGIQQIITQFFLIVLTIVAVILFNAQLFFLLLLILLPPVAGTFYFIKRRLTKDRLEMKISNQKSFQYLLDALKGFIEGNIFNRNHFFLQRFVEQRKKFGQHLFNSISLQAIPSRLIEAFAVMGLFILIVIAQQGKIIDSNALITIGAFMAAAYKIIPGIVKILNTIGQIRAHEISFNDISELAPGEHIEVRKTAVIDSIKFSNVNFQYTTLPVLKNFSFAIQRGDFLGIEGRSGKGKTTIMNLLLGFLSPDCGEIFINDLPLNEKEIRDYWPHIAYVRQQSFLIHDTILRNITLEEEVSNERILHDAIQISGLGELIENSVEGLNKVITENGKNISGGQQQRIALARALYKKADVILLDEPFNELDESSEFSLLNYFKQLADNGKIVVIITHNKKTLGFCNKIISLNEQ